MSSYADFSPTELVRACAGANDEKAWTEFISRFHVVIAAAVMRTARRWCDPSQATLDDLVQETYLKLCEDDGWLLRSFQPHYENSLYGFLKVVAANVVHDYFKATLAKKRGFNHLQTIAEPGQDDRAASCEDSFDIVSHRLKIEQVDKVLVQLTAGKDQGRNCAIFWLRHQQGLTASEIASIPSIGLTKEGVESVLLRLLMLIRSHVMSSAPHREVKVLKRKNRFKRVGT